MTSKRLKGIGILFSLNIYLSKQAGAKALVLFLHHRRAGACSQRPMPRIAPSLPLLLGEGGPLCGG